MGVPLPTAPGREAAHYRRCPAHCPKVERQCTAGVPLPTALRQCGSVKWDFHCPQPLGGVAVRYTAHCPLPTTKVQQGTHRVVHSAKQCGTTQNALMVQRGTQGAVDQWDPV